MRTRATVFENRSAFLAQLREGCPNLTEDRLHVETRLDRLAEALAEPSFEYDLVVLTGDAGDGKTAFCARAAFRLGHKDELLDVTRVGGFAILKDASELPEDALLKLLSDEPRVLLAVNEGRLRRITGKASRLPRALLERALDVGLDGAGARDLEADMRANRLLVLNFRHRANPRGFTRGLLATWTPPELWESGSSCSRCPAKEACPILANARDLRRDKPAEGLGTLLAAAHFAGKRLPLRRVQAVLALALTGGLRCADVQSKLVAPGRAGSALGYRYHSAVVAEFGPAPRPVEVEPEWLCGALAPFDPAREASRDLDGRFVRAALGAHDTGLDLPTIEARALSELAAFADSMPPTELNERLALLVRALRRLFVLEGRPGAPRPDWQRALELVEGFSTRDDRMPLQRALVAGLNRLQGVSGKADALGAVVLDPGGFRDPARRAMALELGAELEPQLARGPDLPESAARYLEAAPAELVLLVEMSGQSVRLPLDLHLVRALLAVQDGFAMVAALGAYRHDLARFYGRLVAASARGDGALSVAIKSSRGTTRVRSSPESSPETGMLRFDLIG